ncbi:Clan CA, family C19, ubiquitin hydrolase-like cysteine peptidase [Trichomonas vaginalis G3]|uniref:ubiquitinyl hydrolase 1 n=1 Tax=Trichomonas vaginalis (strain ATCC PRA-98 / G3) TaxID=412133 RepID=A2DDX8_TRIV3|nr:Clan CA, family C19, ubiquitin hydrolase-like cysteine peptidase family [Trichomonas vaginalis G3]EAY21504.1 Clan CA, family C19, ubiquitin hydrolase-like cysteine peptidase [Trichomonas vaginalis G3]KAI5490720.1 Clan CA, family C19, ubiquitin hydrolase-like cysteine peptidase family [Trichomonas vaginalis G3]|eukprot:XP_001582490.1 Clan CA, family C19, ubiquitin hydrolase-like cysteine peptidase [Trichomonas vaginalis G3]
MSDEDTEISERISNARQKQQRRYINFVDAKYEYKQNLGDLFAFQEIGENCSIIRGFKSGSIGGKQSTLYDPKKLAGIKSWTGGFFPLSGLKVEGNQGFAVSVIYALSSCPSFRQFADIHKTTCHRIGCSLCQVLQFYQASETRKLTKFPLEIKVFDHKYRPGDKGDSAVFLSGFLDILQQEELSSARAFGKTDQYTSAIGQIFRIEAINKIHCTKCGRIRQTKESYWTLCANKPLEDEIDQEFKTEITDSVCDACNGPIYSTQEMKTLPLVFTVQFPHWTAKGDFRKRNIDMSKYLSIEINDRKYKLVAFTAYEGFSANDGRFSTVFQSQSGVWNHHSNGQVQVISVKMLDKFQPQLTFFSVDEPNEIDATSEFVKINNDEDENDVDIDNLEQQESQPEVKYSIYDAMAEIKQDIQKEQTQSQLYRPKQQPVESKEDNEDQEEPIQEIKEEKAKIVRNPLQMLLKKSVHSTGTWDDGNTPERDVGPGFVEEKPDEWDAELDKGHQRKIRTKREIPEQNPFENAPERRRRPGDTGFKGRDGRSGNFSRGRDRDNRRGGFRGRR